VRRHPAARPTQSAAGTALMECLLSKPATFVTVSSGFAGTTGSVMMLAAVSDMGSPFVRNMPRSYC
jgi:hypothetical protein